MINIYNEKYNALISCTLQATLRDFNIDPNTVDIEVEFLEQEDMQALNLRTRGVAAVTDVLSFPAIEIQLPFDKNDYLSSINPENGCVILGEIAICEQQAILQASELNHSISREIAFLACHGCLHLLGCNHKDEGGQAQMEQRVQKILNSLGIGRDIADSQASKIAADCLASTVLPENKGQSKFKSGFIAIVGRPNSGKSTLVNTLTHEKVSIVSYKPQTTRNRIMGVLTQDNFQMVFIDTPGLHLPKNKLGKYMLNAVQAATRDIDALIYMVDGEKGLSTLDKQKIEQYIQQGQKVVIVLNKIDHITKERAGEILTQINAITGYQAVVPISALTGKNMRPLLKELLKLIKEDHLYFDKDMYTDKSKIFIAAEIVREKALRTLDEEIPHGVGVAITKFERRAGKDIVDIEGEIYIEKPQHKPIILGKDGQMIKRIATYARQDLEKLVGTQVFLSLWVKVKKDWRDSTTFLNELGYGAKDI